MRNFKVRHPRCVSSITKKTCVLYTQSNTNIFIVVFDCVYNTHSFLLYMRNFEIMSFIFLLLHRACCRVTQLLHQPLHIYKIYKICILKY